MYHELITRARSRRVDAISKLQERKFEAAIGLGATIEDTCAETRVLRLVKTDMEQNLFV